MAQHFLLSAKARKLNLIKLAQISETEAAEIFASLRWSDNDGEPVCPVCGNTGKCYAIPSRRQWRCSECNHTFSVTSGTIFANHKLPLKTYLIAIALFTNAVKSLSALQLSRDLDCQYKTVWVLSHKIRESLLHHRDESELGGVCEMDGVYVGHYIRPKNNIEKRIDRRKVTNPNKRVVISLRQRGEEGTGAVATRTFILKSENTRDISAIATRFVRPGAAIHADESNAYDDLHAHYDMYRVNHQVEYRSLDGACNNQSESYNARFPKDAVRAVPPYRHALSLKLCQRDCLQGRHEKNGQPVDFQRHHAQMRKLHDLERVLRILAGEQTDRRAARGVTIPRSPTAS